MNVHKTFRRRPGRLLKALCMFNLRPVSTGKLNMVLNMPMVLTKKYEVSKYQHFCAKYDDTNLFNWAKGQTSRRKWNLRAHTLFKGFGENWSINTMWYNQFFPGQYIPCIWTDTAQKRNFLVRIFSVNVTKSTGNYGFGYIYWRNP